METSPSQLSTQVTEEPKEIIEEPKEVIEESKEVSEPIETSKVDDNLTEAGEVQSLPKENPSFNVEEKTVSIQKSGVDFTQADEVQSLPKESPSFNVEEKKVTVQKSGVVDSILSSILAFEGEGSKSSESKHESEIGVVCPLGEDYIHLTPKIIEDKKKFLGVIRLYWPISPDISLKHFPESYKLNSNKEKVLLLYAENFRKQYHANFPTKKPLLLAAENECGVQKMVSTTIRPTKLCYPELHTWQGCANFVSDHIVYQPLECPHLMPEQMVSSRMVLERQSGHCFEMSILLASYLIAAGYEAYVAQCGKIQKIPPLQQTCILSEFQML